MNNNSVLKTLGLFGCFCLLILIVGIFTGCDSNNSSNEDELSDPRFQQILTENPGYGYYSVYVDTETGIQYLWMQKGRAGGLTILLDENGKPLLAEGY